MEGVACEVKSVKDGSLTCRVGSRPTGVSKVTLFVPGLGRSSDEKTFTYSLGQFSFDPKKGDSLLMIYFVHNLI